MLVTSPVSSIFPVCPFYQSVQLPPPPPRGMDGGGLLSALAGDPPSAPAALLLYLVLHIAYTSNEMCNNLEINLLLELELARGTSVRGLSTLKIRPCSYISSHDYLASES